MSSSFDHRRVAILLATYQGGAFLSEQLASLERQTHRDWHLFWRDDGSHDETCAIVEATLPKDRITRVARDEKRLGVIGSFMEILDLAPDSFDYYAFCDQDDLWFPDKLARALQALGAAPAGRPALYCSRQTLVGPDLAPRGVSAVPRRALGFRNALVQNVATGCTIMMNAPARRVIWQAPRPPASSFHDWWCYIVVSGAGGEILFDPVPTLFYRQHGANVVGARSTMERARRAIERGAVPFLRQLGEHLGVLADDLALTAENAATVRLLEGLEDGSAWVRWRTLRRARLYRQSLAEDMLMYLWVWLGAVPPRR